MNGKTAAIALFGSLVASAQMQPPEATAPSPPPRPGSDSVSTPGSRPASNPGSGSCSGRAVAATPADHIVDIARASCQALAEVVAGRSRRSVNVLYRLSGVALAGQNHQCGDDPQHRGLSCHLLREEPRPNGLPSVCGGLLTNPKMTWRASPDGPYREVRYGYTTKG